MSESAKLVASFIAETMREHPTATKVYLGGFAFSVLVHSILKAGSYLAKWKADYRRLPDLHLDDRIEAAVSATMTGAWWGFLQGSYRGLVWPAHLVAVVTVLSSKEIYDKKD